MDCGFGTDENVVKLLESIKLNADRQSNITQTVSEEQLSQLPPEAREILIRGLEDKKQFCNIGFIYAYFDPELAGRFILIDGQQRMTTLFLLLLCVCVKEGEIEHFKRSYFQDGMLKFDYKVREEAHDFLLNFVNHILRGSAAESVDDQHWYYQEYKNDSTINSILNNYKTIRSFLEVNELSLGYIEDFIEFWYFDTNKSKQGEELYIYMNSRGQSVSSNESIKANLLKGLSEQDKHDWGVKWEKWQNMFWKNKGLNVNADNGFEEFLKWIKVIEYLKSKSNRDILLTQINKLRGLKESKRISYEHLSLQKIESYFTALSSIVKFKDEIRFESKWLEGNTSSGVIEYLRIIPVLMYAGKFPECSVQNLNRYSRFFYNITRFDIISKNPYPSLISIVSLTQLFLDSNFTDVSDLRKFDTNKSFDNILTLEETIKLKLYHEQNIGSQRVETEKLFWEAEDHKYCDGRISFLWDYINFQPSLENTGSFNLDLFKEFFANYKLLYTQSDDTLRRALLTKGDYSNYDGRTSTLNGDRYSFINEDWRWKQQFPNKNFLPIYKSLLTDFTTRQRKNLSATRDQILNQIVSDYLLTNPEVDWKYYIISRPTILEYCRQKFICFADNEENIYLLQDKNAAQYNWTKLEKHLGFE